MFIRQERESDHTEIFRVDQLAFGRNAEALLVDEIRETEYYRSGLSLVAVEQNEIMGHIMFSRIWIETERGTVPVLGLAPMAVRPDRQKQGIGSALVNEGLQRCRLDGGTVVVVVGHPDYYPRFGFVRASTKGLKAPFPVPDDAFMVIELADRALDGIEGAVKYPSVFDCV